MDIETAKNIQSLMNEINCQESTLEYINRLKDKMQGADRDPIGQMSIVGADDRVWSIALSYDEASELLDFLSAYWIMKKHNTMKEIEKL